MTAEGKEIIWDSMAHARVIFLKTLNGSVRHNTHSRCITKADKGRGSQEAAGMWSPCLLLWCDRISIKLQLTGKSRLIIQFYHMTRRREIPWDSTALARVITWFALCAVRRTSYNEPKLENIISGATDVVSSFKSPGFLCSRSWHTLMLSTLTPLGLCSMSDSENVSAETSATAKPTQLDVCMYVCMYVNLYLNTENHQLSLS